MTFSNKINPKHHSVSDWDFSPGLVYALTPAYFVSPPTSLKLGNKPNMTPNGIILCRIAETLNLPQGVIVTAARQDTPMNQYRLNFRNQSALGTSDELNCYRIRVDASEWYLDRLIDGVMDQLGHQPADIKRYAWQWLRVIFFTGAYPGNGTALTVTFELYIAGEWAQQGDPIYDPTDRWKDSEINRIGLGTFALTAGYNQWYDDTEIWGPTP